MYKGVIKVYKYSTRNLLLIVKCEMKIIQNKNDGSNLEAILTNLDLPQESKRLTGQVLLDSTEKNIEFSITAGRLVATKNAKSLYKLFSSNSSITLAGNVGGNDILLKTKSVHTFEIELK